LQPDFRTSSWYAGRGQVKNAKIIQSIRELPDSSISLPIGQKILSRFCKKFLVSHNRLIIKKFNPAISEVEISDYLFSRINSLEFGDSDIQIVRRAIALNQIKPYEDFFTGAQHFLMQNTAQDTDFTEAIIVSILLAVNHSSDIRELVNGFYNLGLYHHLLHQELANKNWSTSSLIFLLMFTVNGLKAPLNTHGNSESGKSLITKILSDPSRYPELLKTLAEVIEEFNWHRTLIDMLKIKPQVDGQIPALLVKGIYRELTSSDALLRAFEIDNLNDELYEFFNALDTNEKENFRAKVAKIYIEEFDLVTKILSTELKTEDAWLYVSMLLNDDFDDDRFTGRLKEFLQKEKVWITQIRQGTSKARLLVLLEKRNLIVGLDRHATKGLLSLASETIPAENKITITSEYIEAYINHLKPASLKKTQEGILEIYRSAGMAPSKKFWDLFHNLIYSYLLKNKNNEPLILEFIHKSLDIQDPKALDLSVKLLTSQNARKLNPNKQEVINLRKKAGQVQRATTMPESSASLRKLIQQIKRSRK
jgi:hypothetical protein